MPDEAAAMSTPRATPARARRAVTGGLCRQRRRALRRWRERPQLLDRDRHREIVTLSAVASEGPEAIDLLGPFHALGRDVHVERVAQGDHRLHDGGLGRDAVDALDEGAVELDDVDREPAQIPESRVAGAEVVDGHAQAGTAQALEGANRPVVAEGEALGDLDLQKLGVEPAGGDDLDDLLE